MLRVYALPAVEAATPESDPQPAMGATTAPDSHWAASDQAADRANDLGQPSPSQAVAPPEVINPTESVPLAPAGTTKPEPKPEAPLEPVALPSSNLAPDTAPSPPPAAQKPEAASPSSTILSPDRSPNSGAGSPSGQSTVEDPKAAPNPEPAKAQNRAPVRTVAGMRQILEKRLETLVGEDKATREARWQENLIQVALEYAWRGKFNDARQVATNPGLPSEIQTTLLGQIAAIETQFLASQMTQPQEPGQLGKKPQRATATKPANSGGRNLPSGYSAGYSTVEGLANPSGYPGAAWDNQCPAMDQSLAQSLVASSVAPPQKTAPITSSGTAGNPTGSSKLTTVPSFIPALGQNLATRLVQLSQTAVVQTSTTTSPTSGKQAVSPLLFAGVAAKTAQVRFSVPQPMPQLAVPQRLSPTPPTASQTTSPIVSPPALQPTQPLSQPLFSAQSLPNVVPSAVPSAVPSPSAIPAPARVLPPKPGESEPLIVRAEANSVAVNSSVQSSTAPAALGDPLQWLNLDLPDLLTQPFAWAWWTPPTSQPANVALTPDQTKAILPASASSSSLPDAAKTGLAKHLQDFNLRNLALYRLDLPGFRQLATGQLATEPLNPRFQPLRNAQKLSIPSLPGGSTAAKVPQRPVYDPSTLLAVSCARMQLSHYDTGNTGYTVIDPAVAKRLGWIALRFPLPIPAVITSAFGWRIHPISGDLRFHAGLDLGAPQGTPVLSAASGRVVAADAMGGYGLAVVVEQDATRQRNLYAHLSGIAVQPGARVEEGAILGWVGSTGNSTGPHLHFETQIHTENGWTVIDPLASAAVTLAQSQPNQEQPE